MKNFDDIFTVDECPEQILNHIGDVFQIKEGSVKVLDLN